MLTAGEKIAIAKAVKDQVARRVPVLLSIADDFPTPILAPP
jgi:hypothetical protein